MVWCGVVWCVEWSEAVRSGCGVVRCGVVWRGVTWRGVAEKEKFQFRITQKVILT